MAHFPHVSRAPVSGLIGCVSLALSPSASATPVPAVSAMQPAFSALIRSHGAAADPLDTVTRQLSPTAARRSPASDPEEQVGAANASARVEPENAGFKNAIQRYAYSEGALFQVYTKPGQVTDIALQEGEVL